MNKDFFWDILDQKRKDILPLFKFFKSDFYLAGGTALALQLGHRDSIDFDFFSPNSFSTEELFQKIGQVFSGHTIVKTQEAKDSLGLVVDDVIKISFFTYSYKLIRPLLDEDYFKMASVEDIACMKLSAITSRSVLKDYVDLYFILHQVKLDEVLVLAKEKFPTIDTNPILKSLIYFNDVQEEPIIFKHNDDVSFDSIKKYLADKVKNYLNNQNK